VSRRQGHSALREVERRFWTGPVAHLLGGGLDVIGAFARIGGQRLLGRLRRH
jgi:hypothetical protein